MKTLVLLGMIGCIFSVQAIAGEAGYITNGKKTVVWVDGKQVGEIPKFDAKTRSPASEEGNLTLRFECNTPTGEDTQVCCYKQMVSSYPDGDTTPHPQNNISCVSVAKPKIVVNVPKPAVVQH